MINTLIQEVKHQTEQEALNKENAARIKAKAANCNK